ncbi:MAG: UDP-glucose/GDP-mannose dehydrogenase family protein [Candidatus Vogelbacteria bacterium]|nr:UDP-glucose/GDP-mannose dehydrogenase family protein [Candidatus Vogelbacteria bacterium]
MKVCVIGSGYVGLVTGVCLADFGNTVVCVDKELKKIAALKKGQVDFYELGLKELVTKNLRGKRLSFTNKISVGIISAEIIFIAVGTPPKADGSADLSYLENASRQLAVWIKKANHKKFRVIAVKSTVPVGTAEKVECILIKNGVSSKKVEVISNPEFLREGKAVADFLHPDRIVVGAGSKKACSLMAEIYRPLNARIVYMDRRSAEMVKYASNIFLAARISLINELANICEKVGADVGNVAEGMGYDTRIGHEYLRAGIGYGGSCLPKDIMALTYLAKKKGYEPKLLKSVQDVNDYQKERFAKKVIELLGDPAGKTVGIWGLSFKPQTNDLRDAPSLHVIDSLIKKGVRVRAYDPMINGKARRVFPKVTFCRDPYGAAKGADAALVVTEWNEFREIDFERIKALMRRPLIIDGRNIFDPKVMKETGIRYFGVGIKT